MLQNLLESVVPTLGREALTRITLLLNHIVLAEPEATRRLQAHVGRGVRVEWPAGGPAWLPPPPAGAWHVTPAGLFELDEPGEASEGLVVQLDAKAVLAWLMSGRSGPPPMAIQGDAVFAAEVAWLAQNLRWEIEEDLAGLIGDAPAHQLMRLGRGFVDALSRALPFLRRGMPPSAS
ncbi:MAG: hypothetical protein AB3X41_07520 [Leptothrix ochracea]|uniref:hypothetical protein n=1 Tax=Leptothrix ochracea TaxID=735331 RepID=UPI0034E20004